MIMVAIRIPLFILLTTIVLIALPFVALWQYIKYQPEIWRRIKMWTQPKPDPASEAIKEAARELPDCLGIVGGVDYVNAPQFCVYDGSKWGTD